MANMWRATMHWLGLGSDDEYDDYDNTHEHQAQHAPGVHRRANGEREEQTAAVRTLPREPEPEPEEPPAAAALRPRTGVVRPITPQPTSAKPHALSPASFNEAQELADKFMAGIPVIVNLEGVEKELSRRLVDFASGLCYGLRGQMERVTSQVYLLTPTNVQVSDETRRRLQDAGS